MRPRVRIPIQRLLDDEADRDRPSGALVVASTSWAAAGLDRSLGQCPHDHVRRGKLDPLTSMMCGTSTTGPMTLTTAAVDVSLGMTTVWVPSAEMFREGDLAQVWTWIEPLQ